MKRNPIKDLKDNQKERISRVLSWKPRNFNEEMAKRVK